MRCSKFDPRLSRRCTAISFLTALAAALAAPVPADAGLLITVDKSQQRMIVAKDDLPLYDWPVSTGIRDHDTPAGSFQPFRMEAEHFSREWDDAPMPHSIFFTEVGHAIHGSLDGKHLGRPASHGCVRLSTANATILFKLVRAEKMANTRVVLTGEIPGGGLPQQRLGRDPYAADEALVGVAAQPAAEHDNRSVTQPTRRRRQPARVVARHLS